MRPYPALIILAILLLAGCATPNLTGEPEARLLITNGTTKVEIPANRKFFLKWE